MTTLNTIGDTMSPALVDSAAIGIGDLIASPSTAVIAPWVDPVVDARGFDPRGEYVERFWLGTLGPTACLLLRRLVAGFDEFPDGYELDLDVTASALGLGHRRGSSSPFNRAFHRCVMFGLAQPCAGGYLVRRRIPELPRRNLARLPATIRIDHDGWLATHRDVG